MTMCLGEWKGCVLQPIVERSTALVGNARRCQHRRCVNNQPIRWRASGGWAIRFVDRFFPVFFQLRLSPGWDLLTKSPWCMQTLKLSHPPKFAAPWSNTSSDQKSCGSRQPPLPITGVLLHCDIVPGNHVCHQVAHCSVTVFLFT